MALITLLAEARTRTSYSQVKGSKKVRLLAKALRSGDVAVIKTLLRNPTLGYTREDVVDALSYVV